MASAGGTNGAVGGPTPLPAGYYRNQAELFDLVGAWNRAMRGVWKGQSPAAARKREEAAWQALADFRDKHRTGS